MTDHPITPPPELVRDWNQNAIGTHFPPYGYSEYIATQAARWGADQELLACGKYLERCAAWEEEDVTEMYNYRRPKPPSLKEQALALLSKTESPVMLGTPEYRLSESDAAVVRRALEQLDD